MASEEKELSKPEVVASDLVEEEAEKEEAHIRALLAEAGVSAPVKGRSARFYFVLVAVYRHFVGGALCG